MCLFQGISISQVLLSITVEYQPASGNHHEINIYIPIKYFCPNWKNATLEIDVMRSATRKMSHSVGDTGTRKTLHVLWLITGVGLQRAESYNRRPPAHLLPPPFLLLIWKRRAAPVQHEKLPPECFCPELWERVRGRITRREPINISSHLHTLPLVVKKGSDLLPLIRSIRICPDQRFCSGRLCWRGCFKYLSVY